MEGQKITWLTPHALQQVLTDDIDFSVMLTFLEFYEVLLCFSKNLLLFIFAGVLLFLSYNLGILPTWSLLYCLKFLD